MDRPSRKAGLGATPTPPADITPDWTFTSMGAFADATEADEAQSARQRHGDGS